MYKKNEPFGIFEDLIGNSLYKKFKISKTLKLEKLHLSEGLNI